MSNPCSRLPGSRARDAGLAQRAQRVGAQVRLALEAVGGATGGPATRTATPVSVMSDDARRRARPRAPRATLERRVSSASGASHTVTSSATVAERIESLRRTPAARRSLGMTSRASVPIRSHV